MMPHDERPLLRQAVLGLRGPLGAFRFDHRVLRRVVENAASLVLDPRSDKTQLSALLKLVHTLRGGQGPLAGQQLLERLQDSPAVVAYLRRVRGHDERAEELRYQFERAEARARCGAPRYGAAPRAGTIPLYRLLPPLTVGQRTPKKHYRYQGG